MHGREGGNQETRETRENREHSMAAPGNSQNVKMIRDTLHDIPSFAVPSSYSLRWYKSGDEENWYRIWKAADTVHPAVSADTFRRDFGQDEELLAKRQCFICDQKGIPVGTASAWFDNNYKGLAYGLVHWVAITQDEQGKGLSKPLLSAVLERLAALGHERALLTTQHYRLPAISLYLNFGFRPEIDGDRDMELWRTVRAALPHRALDCLALG